MYERLCHLLKIERLNRVKIMMLLGRPYTDENGYVDNELITDLPKDKMEACLTWIKENLLPRKTPYNYATSYGLKHKLEHAIHIYLTNNQFKDAMLMCGFEPVNPNELNWRYCLSAKSPALR